MENLEEPQRPDVSEGEVAVFQLSSDVKLRILSRGKTRFGGF